MPKKIWMVWSGFDYEITHLPFGVSDTLEKALEVYDDAVKGGNHDWIELLECELNSHKSADVVKSSRSRN